MDENGFREFLLGQYEDKKDRDLKSFLLAMYPLLKDYETQDASFETIKDIVIRALESPPIELNQQWLSYTEPPHDNGMIRKFTAPDLKSTQNNQVYSETLGMAFTYDVVKFQIAEMHSMEGKQLDDPDRYFGLQSNLGYDWYNFTALSVLGCGVSCAIDNEDDFTKMNWSIIGRLLEDGRIYE